MFKNTTDTIRRNLAAIGMDRIRDYYNTHAREIDYGIFSDPNMHADADAIRALFISDNMANVDDECDGEWRIPDCDIIESYKRNIRRIVDELVNEN